MPKCDSYYQFKALNQFTIAKIKKAKPEIFG